MAARIDNNFTNASKLEVVNMLRHNSSELAVVVSHAKLVVDLAWDELAFVRHLPKLHGESTWGITKTCTRFVTM